MIEASCRGGIMKNGIRVMAVLFISALAVFTGCFDGGEYSALYVLEELEAASAISDPDARLERLNIFIGNNSEHVYRLIGYRRAFKTIAEDLGDLQRAEKYLDDALARERDYIIRGDIYYREFAYLWEADSERAVSLAGSLLDSDERYFRLFLYMGYYLSEDEKQGGLAENCFLRAIDLASNPFERYHAMAVLGEHLRKVGRDKEAFDILEQAVDYPYANEPLGRILWERGEREKALEAYIRYTAGVPEGRGDLALDSLYALVYPGSSGLDAEIIKRRITDEGPLGDQDFVDLEGRKYRLSDYLGTKLVVNIWNPT